MDVDAPPPAVVADMSRPLHWQVYRLVVDDIAGGSLRPGDRLPTERAIGARLGVSRATVRRALRALSDDGVVEMIPGRGAFVSGHSVDEPAHELLSFSQLASARGLVATARVLASATRPATIDEAEALGISPGAELFELERVRLLDGIPIAIDVNRIPLARAPALAQIDFATTSLFAALEREGGVVATRADYTIEAVGADARQAELLQIAPGGPLLAATEMVYDQDGAAIDRGEIVYRGDRYRFHTTLVANPASRAMRSLRGG